jgi:hypothetical protein
MTGGPASSGKGTSHRRGTAKYRCGKRFDSSPTRDTATRSRTTEPGVG